MSIEINLDNAETYREYRCYAKPQALHATVDALFAAGAFDIKITPMMPGNPSAEELGLGENEPVEYMFEANFEGKEGS